MKSSSLVALSLLLLSGAAFADPQKFEPVEVRPGTQAAMDYACASSATPSAADTERLLAVNDRAQTAGLRQGLKGAIGQACAAGEDSIVVQRAASGESVTWRAAGRHDYVSIALR